MKHAQNWVAALVLLFGFFAAIYDLDTESLWFDEAWTVWAISPPPPATYEPPRGLRAQVRTLRDSALIDARTTLERVRGDVHPPLYFLLMDAWTFLTGKSVFALRYPALLAGTLAAALSYQVGIHLFDRQTSLYALALLISLPLFTYYTREARMYTLLVMFCVASTWAYLRLMWAPSWWRAVLYALLIALSAYTHYAAVLVALTHGLHLVLTANRQHWLWWGMSSLLALVLFSPWIPTVLQQIRANPGGSLAPPVQTDFQAVYTLIVFLTSGRWWLYASLIALGFFARRIHLLAVLWLVVTPTILLLVNLWLIPIYQIRYTLAILPAFALLCAPGIQALHDAVGKFGSVSLFARNTASRVATNPEIADPRLAVGRFANSTLNRLSRYLGPVVLIGIVVLQLRSYGYFLTPKPAYETTVASAAMTRTPQQPILADIAARDPLAYYNSEMGLTDGMALDLSWRPHTREEIREIVAMLDAEPSVWMIMPVNVAKTWHTAAALSEDRVIGYRDSVANMVIYRFDRPGDRAALEIPLDFTVGDGVAYERGIAVPIDTVAGETLCVPVALNAEAGAGVALVAGFNQVIAQWNGQASDAEACLEIPPDTTGEHHLYLTLYDNTLNAPYPVMNGSVSWGQWLVTHHVDIN